MEFITLRRVCRRRATSMYCELCAHNFVLVFLAFSLRVFKFYWFFVLLLFFLVFFPFLCMLSFLVCFHFRNSSEEYHITFWQIFVIVLNFIFGANVRPGGSGSQMEREGKYEKELTHPDKYLTLRPFSRCKVAQFIPHYVLCLHSSFAGWLWYFGHTASPRCENENDFNFRLICLMFSCRFRLKYTTMSKTTAADKITILFTTEHKFQA